MKIAWTEDAWQDYLHWQQRDEKILAAINELIRDIKRNPFKGLGEPEPLKHALQGWWSRRISGEHRLVDRVSGQGRGAADRDRAVQVSLLSTP
jgi:toxin YoeB